jgi:hypothetical protein
MAKINQDMPAQGSWIEIEKAPKDEVILVNDTTGATKWAAAKWIECSEWAGWSYDDEQLADNSPLGPQPTHFFLLPPVPNQKS